MKIRQGFVSNSSSSSFLIYGAPLEEDEILNVPFQTFKEVVLKSLEGKIRKAGSRECYLSKRITKLKHSTSYDDVNNLVSAIIDFCTALGLGVYEDQSGYLYIGRKAETLGDEETGAEFKASVQEKIDIYFPRGCSWVSRCWYDG